MRYEMAIIREVAPWDPPWVPGATEKLSLYKEVGQNINKYKIIKWEWDRIKGILAIQGHGRCRPAQWDRSRRCMAAPQFNPKTHFDDTLEDSKLASRVPRHILATTSWMGHCGGSAVFCQIFEIGVSNPGGRKVVHASTITSRRCEGYIIMERTPRTHLLRKGI